MAEDPDQPDAVRFDLKDYNVTCCMERFVCGATILILGEEAELKRSWCLGIYNSTKRRQYGELSTVDSEIFCCFYGFKVAPLMPNPEQGPQCIGRGFDRDEVDMVVEELKKRQALRGDRAKVRLAETRLARLDELTTKVDLIMEHLNIEQPANETMQR